MAFGWVRVPLDVVPVVPDPPELCASTPPHVARPINVAAVIVTIRMALS
jgi:hypothetical protein